jgi:signal peptidase I
VASAEESAEQPGHDAATTAGDDVGGDSARPERRASARWALLVVACFGVVVLLRTFVVEVVRVDASSMEPTLHGGDVLVIDKLTYRFRDPRLGEIVTARAPDTGEWLVKRVVGVGGDSVGIEDGVLVRNGITVAEDYIDNTQMEGYFYGPVEVPAGYVFVLGDHRLESVDSRRYGPLALDDVTGRLAVGF